MKESEIKRQRELALEYSVVVSSLLNDKYFPKVLEAVQTKDEKLLDEIFERLEISEEMRKNLKRVAFSQPMAAAPTWG